MALLEVSSVIGLNSYCLNCTFSNPWRVSLVRRHSIVRPLVVEARAPTRTESAKVREIRRRKKYDGTATKPRLSVFCSKGQLYAMLVDDQKKKCLFYASTLQKSIRTDPNMSTVEASKVVGVELVKAAVTLKINEISSYDLNGCNRGERIRAFEIAIAQHGFLPW